MNNSSNEQNLKSMLQQQYKIVGKRIQDNRLYNQKFIQLQRKRNQKQKRRKQRILKKQKFYKENPNQKQAIKEKKLAKANKKLEKQLGQFTQKINAQLIQTQNKLQKLSKMLTNANSYLSLVPQAQVVKYPDNKQQSEQSSSLSRFYKIYYGDNDYFFGNDLNKDQNKVSSNQIDNRKVDKNEDIEKREQIDTQNKKNQKNKVQQIKQLQKEQCLIEFSKCHKIKLKDSFSPFRQSQDVYNPLQICKDSSQDSQDQQQKIRLQDKSLICYIKYIKIQKFTIKLKTLFEQNYSNQLTWLTLTNCNMRSLENIPYLKNLKGLDISHNQLVGSFEFVVKNENLKYINVSHNQICNIEKFEPFKRYKKGIAIYLMDNPIVINEICDLHINTYSQNKQRNLTLANKLQQERRSFEQKLNKIFANWSNQQYQKQEQTTKFKRLQNDKVLNSYFQKFKHRLAQMNILMLNSILKFQLLNTNIQEITNYQKLEELISQLNEQSIDEDSGSFEEEQANFKAQLQSRKQNIQREIIKNNQKLLRKIRKNMYILLMNFTLQIGKEHLIQQELSQKNLLDYQKAKIFYDNRSQIIQMEQHQKQNLIQQLMETAKAQKNPFMYTAVKILKKECINKKNVQELINAHRSQLNTQNQVRHLGVRIQLNSEDVDQQISQSVSQDVIQQASYQRQISSSSLNSDSHRHINQGQLDGRDRNIFLPYVNEQYLSVQEEPQSRILIPRDDLRPVLIIHSYEDGNSSELFQSSDLGDGQDANQSHQD